MVLPIPAVIALIVGPVVLVKDTEPQPESENEARCGNFSAASLVTSFPRDVVEKVVLPLDTTK